ncbi:uncharacterized protein LAESUDRAFT_252607 [Laetiporus sulphureus 93-53]|uniref:Uncharacterized protein n=1 Tax=Laetiporus sulphureus 93-53 TaxID=1314785 RepID=A0A165H1B3_9APHY|nr:uncharacterized protein LAESUDRAFT_252607 [Laetiporus sulphureus 93-53]KZT11106.1 hypothetical protein LAESUDRAFT_252607 [Laetiporus sulphureus 93-53]
MVPSDIDMYTPGQLTLEDVTHDDMSLHVKTAIEGLKPIYALDKVSDIFKQPIPDDKLVRLVFVARRPQLVAHPPGANRSELGQQIVIADPIDQYSISFIEAGAQGTFTAGDMGSNKICYWQTALPHFV